MKWSIITNSTETSGGVDISLTPKDDVTRFTILQYKIPEVPELIKEVSNLCPRELNTLIFGILKTWIGKIKHGEECKRCTFGRG